MNSCNSGGHVAEAYFNVGIAVAGAPLDRAVAFATANLLTGTYPKSALLTTQGP